MHPKTGDRSSTSTQSRSTTPFNVPNAALAGASKAFIKPPTNSVHALSRSSGSNGALSAAKLVHKQATAPSQINNNDGVASIQLHSDDPYIKNTSTSTNNALTPSLSRTVSTTTTGSSSSMPALKFTYSFQAANIAAATCTPKDSKTQPSISDFKTIFIGARNSITSKPKALPRGLTREGMDRPRESGNMGNQSIPERTDATPIPATSSFVKMFEQQPKSRDGTKPVVSRKPSLAQGKPPPIVAPKPQRTIQMGAVSPELPRTAPKPLQHLAKKPQPIPNGKRAEFTRDTPASGFNAEGRDGSSLLLGKPDLPPPLRLTRSPSQHDRGAESKKSTSPNRQSLAPVYDPNTRTFSRSPGPRIRQNLPFNPNRPSPAPYREQAAKRISPSMTGESLANAMVGANLALSSSPMRSKTPPPLPAPRRKGHHHQLLHRARSLSPKKKRPMAMGTLRSEAPDKEREREKEIKKHRMRQPNKHHEGTRERWRDEVTLEEIKKYEGVWAANKGLHVYAYGRDENAGIKEEVQNVVVRDIWSRSRLPPERLAVVWNLVVSPSGRGDTGRLTKDQFVVGMWLIDQSLNGRNLPHSVHPSVWDSVRLRGVKVRLEGKGEDGRKLKRGAQW
ncbi:hypothetical protein EJ08DRAFT_650613 [Tothia fuscella]|uniref:EH domain-containing protein n=1 Tax=Tothia fuscella TaxID=1048955 RepID=A0A9P4NNM7_9PEZI|nr:hypothetical protein EJ08DRAFT_650613 [Tothia fuscella]